MNNRTPDLSDRLVKFSARVIKLLDILPNSLAGKKLSDQLVRSAMSVGANYEEARGADSRNDFAYKLQIALKEARETRYWLCIVLECGMAPESGVESLVDEATQLRAILGKSVATVRGKARGGERDRSGIPCST